MSHFSLQAQPPMHYDNKYKHQCLEEGRGEGGRTPSIYNVRQSNSHQTFFPDGMAERLRAAGVIVCLLRLRRVGC